MRASLPGETVFGAGVWRRLRKVDVERRLAFLLTVSAVLAGLGTYWLISRSPPYGPDVGTVLILLNLDLILLLLLGVIIARRLTQLFVQLRRGSAGSRLHTRLVLLFSGVAVTPAIIVVIFSVFFLSSGLENWFSERVKNALDNSLAVAQAYLQEHKENIRADALAMAADLNRESASLDLNSTRLRQVVDAQAALRSLTEAIVFDGSGRVLARTGLSFTMEVDRIPIQALDRAFGGEVVELTSDTEDRVRALVRLDGFGDAYLFVGRFVDAKVLGFMERTQTMVAEYQRMQGERSGIQITSALIFMIVALLLLFASVWIGLALANQLVTPISRLITAADRVRTGDLLARVPEEGPDSDEFVLLEPGIQSDDGPARQSAPRADPGQPAARRAQQVHRDGAGGRQCRRALHRCGAPDRSSEPGGPGFPRRGRPWPSRSPGRRGAAGRGGTARPGRPSPRRGDRAPDHRFPGPPPADPPGAGGAAARRWADPGLHRHLRRHHGAAVGAASGRLGRGGAPHRARGQEPA